MRKLFILLTLISTLPFGAISQSNYYTVGTPSGSNSGTGYPCPFANWYWGTRQQYLFTAAELQAAGASSGDITEIAFNVLNVNAVPPLQNYQLWIKTTSNTNSLTAWETGMGNPVYGPVTYNVTTGWNTISFPKAFWNGSDNIVIEICSNNSSFVSNGNAAVEWTTGLPFTANRTYYADNSTNCGNASANTFVTPGTRPVVRFRIEPPFPNNAAASNLDKPGEAICDASKDVRVSFENTGIADLTSVTVGWTVIRNGNAFPINYYNWNGQVAPGAEATNVLVGSFSPGFQNQDILKFWTEMPNGVPDSLAANDTMFVRIRDGISGTYNVGGFFNIDFPTLEMAEHFVDSFGAVCDSLIFNIRDGVYYGQMDFERVFNTAPNRPVVFRAENGANANVVIVDSTNGINNNFILKLSGSRNFYFENITFRNASPVTGRTVWIDGQSEDINFKGCSFENNYLGSSSSLNHALVVSPAGSYDNSISFDDCRFSGGSYGVHLSGRNVDTTLVDISISHSTFENQTIGGIHLQNVENTKVNFNQLSSNTTGGGGVGIAVMNNNGALELNHNSILSSGSWPETGISVTNTFSYPSAQGMVYNNFVKVGDSTSSAASVGMVFNAPTFLNIYHNSVLVLGTNSNAIGIEVNGGGASTLINNSISNEAQGVAIYVDETNGFPLSISDYNNYHSSGTHIARYKNSFYSSLAGYRLAIGDDVKSISILPGYISSTDLHVCGSGLSNRGTPLSAVPVDIDGQLRNTNTPDIGADEFQPPSNLDLGDDTVVCKGTEITLFGALNFNDNYTAWSTGDTAATLTVSQPGTYSVVSSNVCGTASDTIVIGLSQSADLGADTNICADATITLDAGVGNGTYVWNTGENTQTIAANSSGIYVVTVTDADNCTTEDTIFVTQSKKAQLPNDTALCGGQSIFLDPGTGPGTYLWSNGASSPVILASSTDTFSVNFTDIFGCASADTVVVISTTAPNAQFTSTTSPGSPATVIFTSNAYPGAEYFWNFGDGDTSSLQNPVHLYPSDGTYLATLQITNDCGVDFYSEEFEVFTSVNEVTGENAISLFPNPTTDQAIIKLPDNNEQGVVELYDVDGKLIDTWQVAKGQQQLELNLTRVAKGTYLVKGTFEGITFQESLIVR